MFQTIYTFRILSFQNSARHAVPQILFITHSAKIISVHPAPPIAQMLRNLQLRFDPDTRAPELFVFAVNETRSRATVALATFINIHPIFAADTGGRVLFTCDFASWCLKGLVSPGARGACWLCREEEPGQSPGSFCPCPCSGRQLGAGQRSVMGFGLGHYFGQFFLRLSFTCLICEMGVIGSDLTRSL